MTAGTTIPRTDVLIVGGGILGTAAAYYLSREGVRVTLVERAELNREASGTNAGSLHGQMFRQPDYSSDRVRRIASALPLLHEAAELWSGLASELNADIGMRRRGGLLVAETDDERRHLAAKVEVEHAAGLPTRLITGDEARSICPCLSVGVIAADFSPEEGLANPLLVTPAFARCAIANGAQIVTHAEVVRLERQSHGFEVTTTVGPFRARRVIDAAGTATAEIAAMLGIDIPVGRRAIQVSATERWDPRLEQLVQHVGRRLTLKQAPVGTFLIGGGWPAVDTGPKTRHAVSVDSVRGNAWIAMRVLPLLEQVRILRTWVGVIPVTPYSMVPVIGEVASEPGFYVLASGVGFTLGPLLGQSMAEIVTRGTSSFAIDAFSPEAFA